MRHAANPSAMLLIVSGPSGVGKTTITRAIHESVPDSWLSVSVTTRAQGPQETDGVHYRFITEEQFDALIADPSGPPGLGKLLEHAGVYGRRYGTPREPVEQHLARGCLVILEIDMQGAIQIKQRVPGAFAIFIMPPSEEELMDRLRRRGRDGDEAIRKRFAAAQREMQEARSCGAYDVFLVNDDLERTVKQALRIVDEERALRRERASGPGT